MRWFFASFPAFLTFAAVGGMVGLEMKTVQTLSLALGLVVLAACGNKEPNAPQFTGSTNVSDLPATTQTNSAALKDSSEPPLLTSTLAVNDAIAKACGLTRPASAPQFDFDSAEIQEDDKTVLAEIAKCLLTGALAGKSLALTGRADARGESEYNMTLGAHRAGGVRGALTSNGVPESRLFVTSRGELDAAGSDEASWARDRRVDIELR